MLQDINLKYRGGRLHAGRSLNISAVTSAPNPATLPLGGTSKAASTGINLIGSFAGGEDDSSGTDSTPRINVYSYQRASTNSFGETYRNFLMRKDSKAMFCWYGPQLTGTQTHGYDANRDALTSGVAWNPWAWLGAHYEANDHNSIHGHISIEVPDTTGALQTRLEILFADRTTGSIGLDKSFIITNQSDFVVRCSSGQVLRMAAAAGTEKTIEFNNDTFGDTTKRRWKVRANSTSETGSNAGTDFEIVRYLDDGTVVDSPIFVTRSNGQVTLGTSSASGVIIRRSSASSGNPALQVQANTAGGTGIEVQTQSTTSRILQALVEGDANRRFYIDTTGQMNWGPASSSVDVNLYRSATDILKTDDSLHVATRLTVAAGSLQTAAFYVESDGTREAGKFVSTADGTASQATLLINPSTTAKRAVDIRLAADSVSRLRIDMSATGNSGTITFGDGTTADVNLYRSAANKLKSDDMVIAALGIGVGNSAAATTPGTVTKKIEVFDASGVSLGFVPVYDAIT